MDYMDMEFVEDRTILKVGDVVSVNDNLGVITEFEIHSDISPGCGGYLGDKCIKLVIKYKDTILFGGMGRKIQTSEMDYMDIYLTIYRAPDVEALMWKIKHT